VISVLLFFIFNTSIYDVFAQDQNNVTIKTTKLTDSLYMLEGLGGKYFTIDWTRWSIYGR
jgi:hypothetical protein